MNAKEFLSRAWIIDQQVQSKLEQIEALRSLASRVTAGNGGTAVAHSRNVTSMQDTIIKITEAEEELNRKIDELVTVKLEIVDVIGRVEDPCLRLILEKRFLLFLSWSQIVLDLHYSDRWMRGKSKEALDAVQRILDEREANGDESNNINAVFRSQEPATGFHNSG